VDKAWLEAQLSAGRSYEAIAEELGRDPSTVSYWARRHGLSSVHVAVHRARGGIDRDALARLVDEGLSVREIARRLELSGATVRHWLREHGLQTRRARTRAPSDADDDAEVALRECSRHGQTKFVRRGDERGWRCLRCRSEAVTRRRQKVKEILVRDAGGRCALCGYDRHVGALEFHHLDPADKRFSLSHMGTARSLERARDEVRKCVLLCANCHAEVEAGVARLTFTQDSAPVELDPG
jgi:transposase